jgi:signal transduction histidine kinase
VNTWLTRANVLAEGLDNLISWDDRLGIKEMITDELKNSDTLSYFFLMKGDDPYVSSFDKGVPLPLITLRPPADKLPVWEFQERDGPVVYDIAHPIKNTGITLRIGLKRSSIDDKIRPMLLTIILIDLISIVLSGYIAVRIARNTTREVDTLAEAISKYGELTDENGTAIDATTSEVSELVSSFKQLTSERKKAEQELARLNAELEERVLERTALLTAANKELDAFAYSVSHDLRAPLRGVEGFSLALLEEYADTLDETAKGYIGRIRKGCVRMGRLIDDLLKLSRITRSEVNRIPINLSRMLEQAIQDLQTENPDRKVDIDIEPGVTANADLTLTRSVIENLVGNAWKFTRYTEKPLIRFFTMKNDGKRIYCIRDNGAGFNMEYADKLFMAFQRLHRADEFEGTGIGLASVHRIILMHGGKIWAEAEEGKGSTFYFTLGED